MFNTKIKWFALLLLTSFQAQAHTDQLPQMSFQIESPAPVHRYRPFTRDALDRYDGGFDTKNQTILALGLLVWITNRNTRTGWLNAAMNVEPWVMGSVAVFAALTWAKTRINPTLQMGVVGIFAIAHGAAHGMSLPAAPDLATTAGLLIGSLLLQSIGYAIGQLVCRSASLARNTGITS